MSLNIKLNELEQKILNNMPECSSDAFMVYVLPKIADEYHNEKNDYLQNLNYEKLLHNLSFKETILLSEHIKLGEKLNMINQIEPDYIESCILSCFKNFILNDKTFTRKDIYYSAIIDKALFHKAPETAKELFSKLELMCKFSDNRVFDGVKKYLSKRIDAFNKGENYTNKYFLCNE